VHHKHSARVFLGKNHGISQAHPNPQISVWATFDIGVEVADFFEQAFLKHRARGTNDCSSGTASK
jgi:hypothetical protein